MHLAAVDLAIVLAPLIAKPVMTAVFRYVGLSTSVKPLTATDGSPLPVGAVFDEIDTGNRWMWNGQTWLFLGQPDLLIQEVVKAINQRALDLQAQLAAEFAALKNTIASGQFVPTQDPSTGAVQ